MIEISGHETSPFSVDKVVPLKKRRDKKIKNGKPPGTEKGLAA
jgi:hypothetical protein